MKNLFAILAAVVLWTAPAFAQFIPDRPVDGVDDAAEMIEAAVEARLVEKIETLRTDEGVDLVVATLSSVAFYGFDQTMDEFATEMFNTWELGSSTDNNGILLLIFQDDRALRIELGSGYDAADEQAARLIITDVITPAFRDGNFSSGIEAGTDAIISRIAGKRRAAALAAEPCPNCGATGLERSRDVIEDATEFGDGYGEKRTSCPSCGHEETERYTIPKRTPRDEGGKSDGEGASGKW